MRFLDPQWLQENIQLCPGYDSSSWNIKEVNVVIPLSQVFRVGNANSIRFLHINLNYSLHMNVPL